MAVLDRMPATAVIDSFKGVLDFYEWFGIPVCRKWPDFSHVKWPEPVVESQKVFGYASSLAGKVSPAVADAYRDMAKGGPFTWKDLLVKGYFIGTHRKMGAP